MKFIANPYTGRLDAVGMVAEDLIANDLRYLKLDQSVPQYIENGSQVGLAEPSFTYASGALSRIDYPSGYYKEFAYNVDGTLAFVDYNGEHSKTFTYLSGVLQSIAVS